MHWMNSVKPRKKMFLLFLLLTSTFASKPDWSAACLDGIDSGDSSPQTVMEKNTDFQQEVKSNCGQVALQQSYIKCYNKQVYIFCSKSNKVSPAVACTFVANNTISQLAVCYPKACDNSADIEASADWLSETLYPQYSTPVTGTCGAAMSAGGVFGIICLVLFILGGAAGGFWYYRKKQYGDYVFHS